MYDLHSPRVFCVRCVPIPLSPTVEDDALAFSTIGAHGGGLFKLFSRAALSDETLGALFEQFDKGDGGVTRLVWEGAYPKLAPADPARWPPFALDASGGGGGGVMYVNAMESPVSCMETEIVAAKNAALAVQRRMAAAAARRSAGAAGSTVPTVAAEAPAAA